MAARVVVVARERVDLHSVEVHTVEDKHEVLRRLVPARFARGVDLERVGPLGKGAGAWLLRFCVCRWRSL